MSLTPTITVGTNPVTSITKGDPQSIGANRYRVAISWVAPTSGATSYDVELRDQTNDSLLASATVSASSAILEFDRPETDKIRLKITSRLTDGPTAYVIIEDIVKFD